MMPRLVSGLLLWMCWGQCPAAVATEPQNTTVLQPGVPIEGQLTADEIHVYPIQLPAGKHWRVAVEQRSVNVTVEVAGPESQTLAAVDNPYHRRGPETLVLLTEVAGIYGIKVAKKASSRAPGHYQVRIDELSATSEEDRRVLAAETATSRAAQLYFEDTAEARRQAIAEYSTARSHWHDLGRRHEEARALHANAVVHRLLDERRQALELAHEVLTLWQALAEPSWEAASLNEIGLNHWGMGEIQQARAFFDRALALVQAIGDRYEEAATRNSICLTFQAQGDLQSALECYELALPVFREVGQDREVASILHNIGNVHQNLGEPQRALDHFQQALAIKQSGGNRRGEANTLNSIAILHRRLGEMQQALAYFDRSLTIHRELGDKRREGGTLSNIGLVYYSLGDPRRALSLLNQALPMRQEVADRRGEAATLNNLGLVHRSLGEPRRALGYHQQALELRRAAGARRGEAIALDLVGRAQLELGDFAAAYQAFDQALALLRDIGDRGRESEALHQKGSLELGLGETEKALVSLGQALDLRRAVGDRAGEARTLSALARAERESGRLAEARLRAESALEVIESLRSRVISPHLRASFLSSQREAYELEIDLAMQLHASEPGHGNDRVALETSERARARTLLDLLREAGAEVRRGVDPALRQRQAELQRRLSAKAERQLAVLGRPHTAEQAAAASAERYEVLAELERVEADIRGRNPRYAALTQPSALTASEIQGLLDRDTVLLEYSLGEERSFLWMVTASAVSSFELPRRLEIEAAAREAYREISTLDLGAGRTEEPAADTLGRLLLGPVAERLGSQRLLIVADGALHYIPFGALPIPRAGSRPSPRAADLRLVERHEVVHLPSASALAMQRRELADRPAVPKRIAVLADPVFDRRDPRLRKDPTGSDVPPPDVPPPDASRTALERSGVAAGLTGLERLPSTRLEAESIAALLPPEQVLMALDFDASRPTLLDRSLGGYRIVHLATHGLIDARHPELSGLVLSLVDTHGQPQDGFLRLQDVYNLELGAELVVLSGCQTALGREIRGEGLVGLTRGFMYAGVPRVMASLWRVQDRATAKLMARFYRSMLADGTRPAAALRLAQLSILDERRWRDPYYWAGFVFQGDWR